MAPSGSRLDAAKMTLDGERIRWLIGKQETLTQKGNVFGDQIDKSRYQFILWKAAVSEFKRNLVLANLDRERTVHELHELTGMPKQEIVECIIALLRWRKIEQAGKDGRSPRYRALESVERGVDDDDVDRGE